MKKIISIFITVIITTTVNGQQTVDYLMKARALTEQGNPDKAINELSGALVLQSDSRLYIERAEANIQKGNYTAAINDFNEANRLTPFSGEYGLARIYSIKGDARTSLYHLEMNLGSRFRKGEKEILLDPAFGAIENRPEWRLFWKKEWYSGLEKAISEIEYYVSSGLTSESGILLAELKRSYPGNDETRYAETLINIAAGKYAEAVRIASGLSVENPLNDKYLRILAKAQTAASNPAGASVTYSKLLENGVADSKLIFLRADSYRKTGENDKALADIEKYLDLYPEDKAAISMAGKIEIASGDNINALKYFSENLKLHPDDAECYTERADSYFISKSWDWAIKDYTMSLDLNPKNSDVWLNKGIALINTGRKEDACHDFRKAFSMGNKRASEYLGKHCIK